MTDNLRAVASSSLVMPRFKDRHLYLTKCGLSTTGPVGSGIGCGKFMPRTNWMRRDGMDSRGGAFGNAPLCDRCAEA